MRKSSLLCLLPALMLGSVLPANAAPQAGCFETFGACMYRAAEEDSWWPRFWRGIDCEIGLWGCLKNELLD